MHHFEREYLLLILKLLKYIMSIGILLATPMNTGCLVIPCMKDNITIALIVKRI